MKLVYCEIEVQEKFCSIVKKNVQVCGCFVANYRVKTF